MLGLTGALLALTLIVVPLDDRPVTRRLPVTLGAIAGARVVEPPRALLGRYVQPGDPEAILRWLRDDAPADANDVVVSSDMAVYGGLVAARTPDVPLPVARARLDALARVRTRFSAASFSVFGTVMRLAPTGVPDLGPARGFFAAGGAWPKIQQYANLPDPVETAQQAALAVRLRSELGPVLDAYLATRARDREADLWLLRQVVEGAYDRVVLGQDDAGPRGLHVRDLAALRAAVERDRIGDRAAIEPGADELALILEARVLARRAGLVPRVAVTYSRPDGAATQDPLEFGPIATTIAEVIRSCGAVAVDTRPDVVLAVRVPATPAGDESDFEARIRAAAPSTAVADVTFLAPDDYAQQRALFDALAADGTASRVAAFASWNTVANTVGTALPEAIVALAGRRLGTYDPVAHARFTFERYVDDVAFHAEVRPRLNTDLSAAGTADHTLLLPAVAAATASENRRLLWPRAIEILTRLYPALRDAGMTITLPWGRTFETEIDTRLRGG